MSISTPSSRKRSRPLSFSGSICISEALIAIAPAKIISNTREIL